jgi:hypothetical protein
MKMASSGTIARASEVFSAEFFGNRSREAAFLFLGHVTKIQWNREL